MNIQLRFQKSKKKSLFALAMKPENYHKIFKDKKCCVLLPTYNNAPVLPKVIKDVMQYTDDIIAVNDGSTDNTVEILKQFPDVIDLS